MKKERSERERNALLSSDENPQRFPNSLPNYAVDSSEGLSMASPETGFVVTAESPAGVALMIPFADETAPFEEEEVFSSSYSSSSSSTSPYSCRMPERLRRRMAEWRSRGAAISVQGIEAKLRDADHRRQEFYDQLSKKASPKRRNLLQSGSRTEELERRMRARLQAAERKRQSNLEKVQMRLAKLDELRQAAKTQVEIRQEKDRKELSSRVEFRFQKAEANRTLFRKKDRLRRASLRERSSQSKLHRMTRESKYKERVFAAISQRRAAAERKRLILLEREKRRAHVRHLRVRYVARSISHQREVERARLKDQMETRLQRAKTQRAEYLKQRANKRSMHEQGDTLSRRLTRCWRRFVKEGKTTFALAKAFYDLDINEKCVSTMPFEQLADLIESRATLQAVKPLLDRLEIRFRLSTLFNAESSSSRYPDIDHLLRKVVAPRRKSGQKNSSRRGRGAQRTGSSMAAVDVPAKLPRYQVRLVLCAYMIIAHPDAVFSGIGYREVELAHSATQLVKELEVLINIIVAGPTPLAIEESSSKHRSFRTQLATFDSAWCTYLNNFVIWKVRDAESLEQDLVRAACQLELSMMQKCKLNAKGDSVDLTHDLKAIKKQVVDDQNLLREKVLRLRGDDGIRRLEDALCYTRSQYFQELEKGSPSSSPTTPFILPASPVPSFPSSSVTYGGCDMGESRERPKGVVRSLFRDEASHLPTGAESSRENVLNENEVIVNEFVHEQGFPFVDGSTVKDDDLNGVEEKIRETMMAAFWDGILESVKGTNPDYGRLIVLMEEIRDELCKVSPESWKEEINAVVNVEVLSKVLNSGVIDMDHFRSILEFALSTLQKLSAPANDTKIRENIEKLLKELSVECQENDQSEQLHVVALIKGLRFVLEQIQELKKEISTAHVRMAETLLNGSAGMEYLQRAFSERYGPPAEAVARMPSTLAWISSVRRARDEEIDEHMSSLSRLTTNLQSHSQGLPALTLRAGRNTLVDRNTTLTQNASTEQPECRGEMIDSLVRLGILKLATRIAGLNHEDVPETLRLNLSRLRRSQAQVQKITVILTSCLVIRQVILSRSIPALSSLDMEKLLPRFANHLSTVLESDEDAGIKEIVDVISNSLNEDLTGNSTAPLQSAKELIAGMLLKSLQAGDAVFERVSGAFYKAARGVVLGGSGPRGRELARLELQKAGAAFLADLVVEVAEPLVAMAAVSVSVHGAWYAKLVDNGR